MNANCQHCKDGFVEIPECPMEYVGGEFIDAANMASLSGKGDWPVAGGLLDQSAWFVSLVQRLRSERDRIDSERTTNGR